MFTYYAYLKINSGISYKEFLDEDIEVINILINIQALYNEKEEQEVKKQQNGLKRN